MTHLKHPCPSQSYSQTSVKCMKVYHDRLNTCIKNQKMWICWSIFFSNLYPFLPWLSFALCHCRYILTKKLCLKEKVQNRLDSKTNTGQGKTPVCRILATDSQNNSRVSYIAFWSVDLSYTLSMSDDETCLLPPSCTEISRPTSVHFIPHLPCCSLLPEIPPSFKTFLKLPCKPVEIV